MSTQASTSNSATDSDYGDRSIKICGITIKESQSLAWVDLSIGKEVQRKIEQERTKSDTIQGTFTPPLELSAPCKLTLRLHYRVQIGKIPLPSKSHKIIEIDPQELLASRSRQEWQRGYGKTDIAIVFLSNEATLGTGIPESRVLPDEGTGLSPTTHDIIRICPRFRILVIGESGVGKSSLINGAFRVTKASVSHLKVGKATIDTEIISESNDRFVLHDSNGFEPGEEDNVHIVQNFMDRRRRMPDIKDQLHAVWLCFEIPCTGGRIFKTGVEEFLDLKTSGKLGKIPVIAVFTKYDKLIDHIDCHIDQSRIKGLDEKAIALLVKNDAETALRQICTGPFEKRVEHRVPYMTVSTKEGHEATLDNLIDLTFRNVQEHVANEPSIVSAMAQTVSPRVKIDASIDVGKKKYWRGLASSAHFPGKSLKNCLVVIHVDIVAVWSFDDPCMHLHSAEFQALMYDLITALTDGDAPDPNRGLSIGLSMVGTIAGIVSALAGPAAPIVVPIAASLVLAKWLYDVYQQTEGTLRRLMEYIVNLTLVMQNLFWLAAADRRPITRRLVKLAFKAYKESPERARVHHDIGKYVKGTNIFHRGNRDGALDKIVELIDRSRIDSTEMLKLRGDIGDVDLSADEPWDTTSGPV